MFNNKTEEKPQFDTLALDAKKCSCAKLIHPLLDSDLEKADEWKNEIRILLLDYNIPIVIIDIIRGYHLPILIKSYFDLVVIRQSPRMIDEIHKEWEKINIEINRIKSKSNKCMCDRTEDCETCTYRYEICEKYEPRLTFLKKQHKKICNPLQKLLM